MLFCVSWNPRAGQAGPESEAALEMFTRWTPPAGMDIKAMYARVDGGGFCVCEVSSAEVVFSATAPWAGVYLDYEVVPIVEIDKAVGLLQEAIAFRNG